MNLTGRLLIASPHLHDGHFLRTVSLIVRHDKEGALGFVLNRPTDKRLREVVDWNDAATPLRSDDHLYWGGPVEGPLVALHSVPGIGQPCGEGDDQSTVKIEDHPAEPFGELSLTFDPAPLWITTDEDHVRVLARRTDALVRLIVGYAGWGPGQLEGEIEAGGWLHTSLGDPSTAMGEPEALWETSVKRCGREVLEVIDRDLPRTDPTLN